MNAVRTGLLAGCLTLGGVLSAIAQSPQTETPSGTSRVAATKVAQAGGATSPARPRASEGTAGQVRQVADRRSRGILGNLFGSRSESRNTASAPTTSRGILSGVFSSGGSSDDDGRRVIEPVSPSEPANWSGVPYHAPDPYTRAAESRPLSDPNDPSNRRMSEARIASRGGPSSSSGTTARPENVSSRRLPDPPSASPIPVPPSEAEIAALSARRSNTSQPAAPAAVPSTSAPSVNVSTFDPPSRTQSSRRSRRRPMETLALEEFADSEVGSSVESSEAPSVSGRRQTVPQPRVARRPLPMGAPTPGPISAPKPSLTPPSLAEASETTPAPSPAMTPPQQPNETVASRPAARTAQNDSSRRRPTSPSPSRAVDDPPAIDWRPAKSSGSRGENLAERSTAPATPESASNERQSVADRAAVPDRQTPNVPSEALTGSSADAPAETAISLDPGNEKGAADLDVTPHAGNPSDVPTHRRTAINSTPINVASEIPGLRVVTTGPADIPIRQSSVYQIQVENLGRQDAPGAAIQVKLPVWVDVQNLIPSRGEIARQNSDSGRELLWVIEGLPQEGKETLALHLSASQAKAFELNVEWAVVPQSNVAKVTVREPKLQLVIDGPDQVIYGQSETYRVRVVNPGNGVAKNVVFTLSPNSATPQTQRVADILPGQEASFDVELTARDLEDLQIHGLATADLNLKQEQIKTIQVVAAKLQAVLTGPPLKYQDSIAQYKLQLSNNGTTPCNSLQAVLELPPGVAYQSGLADAQVEGNLVQWTVASLQPGQTTEFSFQARMQQTGEQQLQFRCQGSAAGATAVAFGTRVEALADLVLSINDPSAPAPVGDEVTYEIMIHNRGSKAAEKVKALAHFSNHIEPIRIEGGEGAIEPGQVKFVEIPRIAAGQTVRLKVVAKAAQEGHHRFRVEVECGDTLLIAEEATRYLELVGQRVSRRSDDEPSR